MSLFQVLKLCSLVKTALNPVKPVDLNRFGMIKRVIPVVLFIGIGVLIMIVYSSGRERAPPPQSNQCCLRA